MAASSSRVISFRARFDPPEALGDGLVGDLEPGGVGDGVGDQAVEPVQLLGVLVGDGAEMDGPREGIAP